MNLRPDKSTVQLSVRELAEFNVGPSSGQRVRSGRWRAQLGTVWHNTSRQEMESAPEGENARFEVPLSARLLHGQWIFELQGRVDQVLQRQGKTIFREVKTINRRLPVDPEELLREYPGYAVQAYCYQRMASVLPDYQKVEIASELHFIDIEEGLTQTIPMEEAAADLFDEQLTLLADFADQRKESAFRLQRLKWNPPFETLREGQPELIQALESEASRHRCLLVEAPTGFGKTGILLDFALRQLQSGLVDRAIYLTSKSTGQLQVMERLKEMVQRSGLGIYQMRNKQEHAIASFLHTCGPECRHGIEEAWENAALRPWQLIRDDPPDLEEIRRMGAEMGICPYEISRAILPYAEFWVADFNYVFSPSNSSVFFEQPGFAPARTLLIVDEAHNLPTRVADVFSTGLSANKLDHAHAELNFASVRPRLIHAIEALHDYVAKIRPSKRLDLLATYELRDLCETFAKELQDYPPRVDAVTPEIYDYLWRVADVPTLLKDETLDILPWSETKGSVELTCLDAATRIGSTLGLFGQTVLMSATLSPRTYFADACGLAEHGFFHATAPWRDNAYHVACDLRVDTRYKNRSRTYELTARTISQLAQVARPPLVVFFPSYDYARTVDAYVETLDPGLRVASQPSGLNLADQETFIEESLLSAHVLFLVLGSSFAEGIDHLGGRIDTAMVVGPALPEVNPVQHALMEKYETTNKEKAFYRAYEIPAMVKINQALGRLVRGPGQTAKVLLHCQRFGQSNYQRLLAPEYQTDVRIKNGDDLEEWMRAHFS